MTKKWLIAEGEFDRNSLRAEQQRTFRSTTDCILQFPHTGNFLFQLTGLNKKKKDIGAIVH